VAIGVADPMVVPHLRRSCALRCSNRWVEERTVVRQCAVSIAKRWRPGTRRAVALRTSRSHPAPRRRGVLRTNATPFGSNDLDLFHEERLANQYQFGQRAEIRGHPPAVERVADGLTPARGARPLGDGRVFFQRSCARCTPFGANSFSIATPTAYCMTPLTLMLAGLDDVVRFRMRSISTFPRRMHSPWHLRQCLQPSHATDRPNCNRVSRPARIANRRRTSRVDHDI